MHETSHSEAGRVSRNFTLLLAFVPDLSLPTSCQLQWSFENTGVAFAKDLFVFANLSCLLQSLSWAEALAWTRLNTNLEQ